jgi:SAM-dependent methyltransferase
VEQDLSTRSYYEQVWSDSDKEKTLSPAVISLLPKIKEQSITEVQDFVDRYGLEDARTLDVGAGSGQFQDIVADYTGLDIAASAATHFHKPFVQGSALDLPFGDNEFDSVWTLAMLEHVPDPEKALEEIRRVGKPGGMLLIAPAWNCVSWTAYGYQVRPYEDLSWTGKLAKASLVIRANPLFRFSYMAPTRLLRYASFRVWGQQHFRYTAIRPNYTNYWMIDADAVASFDAVEAITWFLSRGDECLNCPANLRDLIFYPASPIHIRLTGK